MATKPRDNFDFEEQRVRILRAIEESEKFTAEQKKLMAEEAKLRKDTDFMPRAMIFQAMLATAALLGAGAAITKLFFP
jgi:hypothetical protein